MTSLGEHGAGSGTSRRGRWTLATLAAVALALHGVLFWIGHVPGPRTMTGDELVYWPSALQVAAGQSADGYSPLWPRGYLWFLAAVVRVCGPWLWMVELVQVAMLLATALLVRDLVRNWTGSRLAADLAGSLTALYPPLAAYAHYLWPETLHLFLFVASLRLLTRPGAKAASLFASGVCLGLALATKNLLLPFVPLLALAGPASSIRQRSKRAALLVAGLLTVYIPLGLLMSGTYSTSAAAGFNLWVGLHDTSRREFVDPVAPEAYRELVAGRTPGAAADELWRAVREKIETEGAWTILRHQLGKQYFRLLHHESVLVTMLRGKSIHPAAPGYRDPPRWLAALLTASSDALYALVLVAAAWGIAGHPPRRDSPMWLAAAFLLYNALLFLLLHAKTRYRVQLLPFLFLYAGWATSWLAARLGWTSGDTAPVGVSGSGAVTVSGTGRQVLAAASSLLLLLLAFGADTADSVFGRPGRPDEEAAASAPLEAGSEPGALWADPSPIRVCGPIRLGTTTLRWRSTEAAEPANLEVRVGAPDGRLFARGGKAGSAVTGPWVTDGMAFYLVAVDSAEVLASTRVQFDRSGCLGP